MIKFGKGPKIITEGLFLIFHEILTIMCEKPRVHTNNKEIVCFNVLRRLSGFSFDLKKKFHFFSLFCIEMYLGIFVNEIELIEEPFHLQASNV